MESVDLSIIVPCYNEGATLEEVMVEMVAALEAANISGRFQLILVDDASSDNSRALIEQLAARYDSIDPVYATENGG
ncbi:MAG: glycosyltransferase, partial [Pseudomonadota bacterium]